MSQAQHSVCSSNAHECRITPFSASEMLPCPEDQPKSHPPGDVGPANPAELACSLLGSRLLVAGCSSMA